MADKINTEACVKALVAVFPKYGKDWKRLDKKKDEKGNWVRRFQSREHPKVVAVVVSNEEDILQINLEDEFANLAVAKKANGGLFEKLFANPIKVDFGVKRGNGSWDDDDDDDLAEVRADYSGSVIYDRGEEGEFDDGVVFACGPETRGGALSDQEDPDFNRKLEDLFADFPPQEVDGQEFPGMEVSIAENMHSAALIPGISPEDLWRIIEKRLVASGAVQMRR